MRCEYCRMAEAWEPFFPFHVEHIRARQHNGADTPDNLAYACNHCNLFKGPNLTSIDPDTGLLTPLFNPRMQLWSEHFVNRQGRLFGLTAVGRTTVFLLQMNVLHRVELRLENGAEW
jgi:hypothetical protein